MDLYSVKSDAMELKFDSGNGTLRELKNLSDPHGTNWIDPRFEWGKPLSFEFIRAEKTDHGYIAFFQWKEQHIFLTVTRSLSGARYTENYEIENRGSIDFFLTHDNFGIRFPYNCSLEERQNLLNDCVVSHLWCGGDSAWIYSCKPNGERKYLICMAAEGSFDEYSQEFNFHRTGLGSRYRGLFILHPSECVIPPGGKKKFSFLYTFSEKRPDLQLIPESGQRMFLRAEKYTLLPEEKVACFLETAFSWDSLEIESEGKSIPFEKDGRKAVWNCSFSQKGEHRIVVRIGELVTWMDFNVTDSASEILVRRAEFICEKQQYHREGSPLDGAYLIYDRETDRMYCDALFHDSNAAKERLAMGITVAAALQRKPDPRFSGSLKRYRAYLEREILDLGSFDVYEAPCREEGCRRAYNYPWMADFYLELYLAEHDITALRTAGRILLKYFSMIEKTCQDSPCLEEYRVIRTLEEAGECELAGSLKTAFLNHADELLRRGTAMYSEEVSYTQAQFYMKIISLCRAYQLTGEKKYLAPIPDFLRCTEAFAAEQPSFHSNLMGVRWWDLFWFGKSKCFGDTMPQWLGACCGEMYLLLHEILGDPEMKRRGEAILRNALCVYDDNGFGCAGYLMPYHVEAIYPPEHKYCIFDMKPGLKLGKHYDAWADDQDFGLYYAVLRKL